MLLHEMKICDKLCSQVISCTEFVMVYNIYHYEAYYAYDTKYMYIYIITLILLQANLINFQYRSCDFSVS